MFYLGAPSILKYIIATFEIQRLLSGSFILEMQKGIRLVLRIRTVSRLKLESVSEGIKWL